MPYKSIFFLWIHEVFYLESWNQRLPMLLSSIQVGNPQILSMGRDLQRVDPAPGKLSEARSQLLGASNIAQNISLCCSEYLIMLLGPECIPKFTRGICKLSSTASVLDIFGVPFPFAKQRNA